MDTTACFQRQSHSSSGSDYSLQGLHNAVLQGAKIHAWALCASIHAVLSVTEIPEVNQQIPVISDV